MLSLFYWKVKFNQNNIIFIECKSIYTCYISIVGTILNKKIIIITKKKSSTILVV